VEGGGVVGGGLHWLVVVGGGEMKQTNVAFFFYTPKNGELKNSLVCVILGNQWVTGFFDLSEKRFLFAGKR
jgi:hypothetical protein